MKFTSSLLAAALVAGSLLLSSAAYAQGKPGAPAPPGRPGGAPGSPGGRQRAPMTSDALLKRMTEQLSLTADQQKKAKPVIDEMLTKMKTAFGNRKPGERPSEADRDAMRQKMQGITEDFKKKMKPILKPDQVKKLDEMSLRGRRRGPGGPGGPGAPGRPGSPGVPGAPKKP